MHQLIHSLGIMQGRLLPKYIGRYQAHPLGYWQSEFTIARDLDLDYIEFILDYNDVDQNPLMSKEGINRIREVVQNTGVGVRSVCADYFMEAPLHSVDETIADKSAGVMKCLLENGSILGITDIVIPCVDQSSLIGEDAKKRLVKNLSPFIDAAERFNINLSLETDLPPAPFLDLLNRFDSKKITVNYDTGNSASLGFTPAEEFAAYGNRISDIHIKDRKMGGGSVFLGTGDADFVGFFMALETIDYKGPFVMQAFRDDEGVQVFKEQLNWFTKNFA